ncbi:LAQU0S15e02806g1_1 [Lachancea quebecensis]|uniref:LAQU0S15e02806g1_1 n=1 Tax=Lachancea quebecensis TaxID=1654605 RepID=A0A0P1KVT4_9SACH|nr:LAQU0S15e02806g1_1 [Lachancea quebecensis]
MMEEDEISKSLEALSKVEDEVEKAERETELFRLKKLNPVYLQRKAAIAGVPEFWKVVLSQHSDFANYVRAADLKYIDCIRSIEVTWLCVENEDADHRDFSVTIDFVGIDGDFEAQKVSKNFRIEHDVNKFIYRGKRTEEDDFRDEELGFLTSEPCDIKWPKSFDGINPSLVTDKKTAEGKRNYRTGMKSFFSWFKWTGIKPGKEFPNGDGLALLISEDLYPNCTKYYTEAQIDLEEENVDEDDESDEPLEAGFSDREPERDGEGEENVKRRKL